MGWAFKSVQSRRRFSDDVVKFLNEKFEEGVNNKKLNPVDVEKQMQTEKIGNKKRFLANDRLSARQIASYFSRKASEKRKTATQQLSSQTVKLKLFAIL